MKQKIYTVILLTMILASASCSLFYDEPSPNGDAPQPTGHPPEKPNDEREGDEDEYVECPEFTSSYQGYIPTFQDRDEFSYHYNRWLKTCCNEDSDSLFSSRSQDYTNQHPDYEAIIEMGFRALPLVFEAMELDGEFLLNSAAERITRLGDILTERGEDPFQLLKNGMLGEQTRMTAWIDWWRRAESDPKWAPCQQNSNTGSPVTTPSIPCIPSNSGREASDRFWAILEQYKNSSFVSIDLTCDGHPNYAVWRENGRAFREAWDFDGDGFDDWVWEHHKEYSERIIYQNGTQTITQRVVVQDNKKPYLTIEEYRKKPAERLVFQNRFSDKYLKNEKIEAHLYLDKDNDLSFSEGPIRIVVPVYQDFDVVVDPPYALAADPNEIDPDKPLPEQFTVCEPLHNPDAAFRFEEAVFEGYDCLMEIDSSLAETLAQVVMAHKWRLQCRDIDDAYARVPLETMYLAGRPAHQSPTPELIIYLSHKLTESNAFTATVLFHEILHVVLQMTHEPGLEPEESALSDNDQVYGCEQYCFPASYLKNKEVRQYHAPDKTPAGCARCLGTSPADPRCNKNKICGDSVHLCSCSGELFKNSGDCVANCTANLGCFTDICTRIPLSVECTESLP